MNDFDCCTFAQKMVVSNTIKESGLMDIPTDTLKKAAKCLKIVLPQKTNDRKKMARGLINYVKENCCCLNEAPKSRCKTFAI